MEKYLMLLTVSPMVNGFGVSGDSCSDLEIFFVLSPMLTSLTWFRNAVPNFSSTSAQFVDLETVIEPIAYDFFPVFWLAKLVLAGDMKVDEESCFADPDFESLSGFESQPTSTAIQQVISWVDSARGMRHITTISTQTVHKKIHPSICIV